MQTHTKKRIEIIIEAPVLNRLVKQLVVPLCQNYRA